MNQQPRIVGWRLLTPPCRLSEAQGGGTMLARLTLQLGPLVIRGFMLCVKDDGTAFLRPPRTYDRKARVFFHGGPEREAIIDEALSLIHAAYQKGAENAVPPLATAPKTQETVYDNASCPA
jgi:hypothetical protein